MAWLEFVERAWYILGARQGTCSIEEPVLSQGHEPILGLVVYSMFSRIPDFLLIGAPKAGTSSIHYYLEQHPQVVLPPTKETNFFCCDFESQARSYIKTHVTSPNEYFALFASAKPEQVTGEVCPAYLGAEHAPRLIKRYAPDAKLFVVLRDPVDVLTSLYGMRQRQQHRAVSFELFLSSVEAAFNDRTVHPDSTEAQRVVRHISYGSMLARYYAVFAKSQIHVLWYDHLDADTERFMSDMFAVLGLAAPPGIDYSTRMNRGGLPRGTVRRHLHALVKRPLPGKRFVKSLMSPQAVAKVHSALGFHHTSGTLLRPTINANQERRIRQLVSTEIEKLHALTGRSLDDWKG